ncbi:MAG: RNA pyrophosphohydrolase [Neisseriales bacterium]|nr:MAG: RNA pyrophosphohydrolase [Neisseriales bacterium]
MIRLARYRHNVGMIIVNQHNQVFWAKRAGQNVWQFPQGGIQHGESPKEAMYRELFEETGLLPAHVNVLGQTQNWIRYDIPAHLLKPLYRFLYRGQQQIWFLMRLIVEDSFITLDASAPSEFDKWCWLDYWKPTQEVVNFKQAVYREALQILSVHLIDLMPNTY